MVATLTVPTARSKSTLVALADLDHDGKLSAAEEAGLRTLLVERALDGVALHVGTATVALAGVEVKLKVKSMELMLHGVATLPKGPVKLGVTTATGGDPLVVRVLHGSRPPREPSRGTPTAAGFKAELTENDGVWWKLE